MIQTRKLALKITVLIFGGFILVWGVACGICLYVANSALEYNMTTFSIVSDNFSNDAKEMQDIHYDDSKQSANTLLQTVNTPFFQSLEIIPFLGSDFKLLHNVSKSINDIYNLISEDSLTTDKITKSVDTTKLVPNSGNIDVGDLRENTENIANLAKISDGIYEELRSSSSSSSKFTSLFEDLNARIQTLNKLTEIANALFSDQNPHYMLLAVMNNAELRAQGGIVGSTVLMKFENQHISLEGTYPDGFYKRDTKSNVLPLTNEEQLMFPDTFGKWVQDASTTPDFSRTGQTMKALFEEQIPNVNIESVIGIDPYVLPYFMRDDDKIPTSAGVDLTKNNIAQVLTSDVYQLLPVELQDGFFAEVSHLVFDHYLSANNQMPKTEKSGLLDKLGSAFQDRRIKLWSSVDVAQNAFKELGVSGVPNEQENILYGRGPAINVSYNSFASSKMDYYLKQEVSVVSDGCRFAEIDGDNQTVILDLHLQNTASAQIVHTLSDYVTGANNSFNTGRDFQPGDIFLHVMVSAPTTGTILDTTKQYSNSPEIFYTLNNMQYSIQDVKLKPSESADLQYKINLGEVSVYNPNNVDGNYLQVFATPTRSDLMHIQLDRSPCL